MKAIKSDSDSDSDEQKKGRQVLRRREKKPGDIAELATKKRVTPSVAAPGVTHPSDATVQT